ncbi:MAG: hypothetical protein ACE5GW_00210 [Planctomycetota bacterium]
MIGIFQRLFGGRHPVSLTEVREALEEVERDRRRNRVEIRRWERKRKQTIERMKRARGEGNQLEIDYLWDQFKEHRRSGGELRREGRTYNLEAIALGRTVKALEHLERRRDRDGARNLLERVRHSGLMERLAIDRDAELHCLEEMSSILEEFGGVPEEIEEDPEKALFMAELDGIREAEQKGDSDEASEREEELIQRFSDEPEAEP